MISSSLRRSTVAAGTSPPSISGRNGYNPFRPVATTDCAGTCHRRTTRKRHMIAARGPALPNRQRPTGRPPRRRTTTTGDHLDRTIVVLRHRRPPTQDEGTRVRTNQQGDPATRARDDAQAERKSRQPVTRGASVPNRGPSTHADWPSRHTSTGHSADERECRAWPRAAGPLRSAAPRPSLGARTAGLVSASGASRQRANARQQPNQRPRRGRGAAGTQPRTASPCTDGHAITVPDAGALPPHCSPTACIVGARRGVATNRHGIWPSRKMVNVTRTVLRLGRRSARG